MSLTIQELNVSFGHKNVVSNLNLELDSSEIIAILGPSGCGKTTLLRAIAGLQTQSSGQITLNGERIDAIPWKVEELECCFSDLYYFRSRTYWATFSLPIKKRIKEI
tara:strand:- start:1473 stop:1793 length:321 start_codon:yes stop_codon:yes gene_type:complete